MLKQLFFLMWMSLVQLCFANDTNLIKQEIDTVLAQDSYFIKRRQMHDDELKKIADTVQVLKALAPKKDTGWAYIFDKIVYGGLVRNLIKDCDEALYLAPEKFPQLHAMLHEFCVGYDMPIPLVFLSEKKDLYNAVADSLTPSRSAILVSKMLIDDMTDTQLRAVLAHELAHIKYGHGLKKIVFKMGMYLGAATLFTLCLLYGSPTEPIKNIPMGMLGALSIILCEKILANVLSRQYEQEADEEAVKITGNSASVASFLTCAAGHHKQVYDAFQKEQLFVLKELSALVKEDSAAGGAAFSALQNRAEEVQEMFDNAFYAEDGSHPSLITRILRAEQK